MPAFLSAQKRLTFITCGLLACLLVLVEAHAASLPWASSPGNNSDNVDTRLQATYYGIIQGHCEHKAITEAGRQTDSLAHRAPVARVTGNIAGRTLNEADRRCIGNVFEYAPDRLTVRWQNSGDQNRYRLTPYHTRQLDNRYCRDYTLQTELRDGRLEEVHGRACRLAEAEWQLIGSR